MSLLSPLLRRPLLCLTLAWLGGIVLSDHLPIPVPAWILAALILLAAWLVMSWHESPVAAVTVLLAVLCLGAARWAWQQQPLQPGDPRYLPEGHLTLLGYPTAPPTETESGWRVPFRVLATESMGHHRHAAGTVYLSGRTDPPRLGCQYRLDGLVLPADDAGNPFGFSFHAFLLQHGYTRAVRVEQMTLLPEPAPVSPLITLREWLHRRLAATFAGGYGELHARLLDSLLLGIRGAGIPDQFTAQFRRAGIIHLMVVSGSQVALLAGLLLFPLWFAPRGRVGATYPRWRILLLTFSLPVLFLYITLADRGPSVDRALVMALLGILALLLGFSPLARRRPFHVDGLTLLAAAALVVTAVNPSLLFNPGMQLSFAAVLGLMTVTTSLRRLLEYPLGRVALWPAATLGAQVLTAPVLAWHFGVIPVLGVFTNLLAVPVVALLVPLGLLTLLFAVVAPPVAVLLNHLNVPLLRLLVFTGQTAAAVPWAEARWVVRSPWVILLYLASVGICTHLLSRWADRLARDRRIPEGSDPPMW